MPDWVMDLVTLLLSGGLITTIIAWKRQKHMEPIEHETALAENAKVMSEASKQVIDSLTESMERMDQRLIKHENTVELLRNRVDLLQNTWHIWWNDLNKNWSVYRLEDEPPKAPKF